MARLATEIDSDIVGEISASAYLPAYRGIGIDSPAPAFEDYLPRIRSGHVWLLSLGSEPAGVLVIEPLSDALVIYSLAVKPSAQRQGLGRELIRLAARLAEARQLPFLRLYTNARMSENIRFYEQVGFYSTGRRQHPVRTGEWLIDMEMHVGTDPTVEA